MQGLDFITFEDLYLKNIEVTDIHAERQKWVKGVTSSRLLKRSLSGGTPISESTQAPLAKTRFFISLSN